MRLAKLGCVAVVTALLVTFSLGQTTPAKIDKYVTSVKKLANSTRNRIILPIPRRRKGHRRSGNFSRPKKHSISFATRAKHTRSPTTGKTMAGSSYLVSRTLARRAIGRSTRLTISARTARSQRSRPSFAPSMATGSWSGTITTIQTARRSRGRQNTST